MGTESERLGEEGEGPGMEGGIGGSVCLGGYVSGVWRGLWGVGWCGRAGWYGAVRGGWWGDMDGWRGA